ncbi:MAG: hypothetical protein ABSC06_07830 [Rhodopila sp.]|jgi:hypothetical protein
MTESRATNWDPEQELAALLDGLTQELLGAFDYEVSGYEVSGYPGETADGRQDKAEVVRRLVAAAKARAGGPAVSQFVVPGSRVHDVRNR